MKLRKSDWIAIIITLVFIQLLSLWCVDVSVSTLLMKNNLDIGGSIPARTYVTNGFFTQNPLITYHLGLYVLVIACFLSMIFTVHVVLQSYPKEKHKLK